MESALAGMLVAVNERAYVRSAKLLSLRSGNIQHMRLDDFVAHVQRVVAYMKAGDAMAGAQCHGLSGTLVAQARDFLEAFHEQRSAKLGLLLEHEQWLPGEVPHEVQAAMDALVGAPADGEVAADGGGDKTNADALAVGGQRYKIMNSTLMMLMMVDEYMLCAAQLPVLATDVQRRLGDLLKSFNTRTFGLILNADAIEVAGLRRITAKHIALMSESLSALIALLPALRARFEAVLAARQHILLASLDAIKADLEQHRAQLTAKLANLVTGSLESLMAEAAGLPWTDPEPQPSPSAYVKNIVKDIAKLHKIVRPLLSGAQTAALFDGIFETVGSALLETYGSLPLLTPLSQNRLYADIAFYQRQLDDLGAGSGPGTVLEDFFRARFGAPT